MLYWLRLPRHDELCVTHISLRYLILYFYSLAPQDDSDTSIDGHIRIGWVVD